MNKPSLIARFSMLFLIAVLRLPIPLSMQQAAAAPLTSQNTYTVNTSADTLDIDPTNGICADASGFCSLRAAIEEANFHAGADTINLPTGVYLLTRAGDEDGALLGDLDITGDLTIQGAGSGVSIVDGNGAVTGDRVFQILSNALNVSLSGLTIRNGRKVTNTFDEGGGLYWDGSGSHLTLSDVIIESNQARYGGGLYLNYSGLGDVVSLNHLSLHANIATTGSAGGMGANFGDLATLDLSASQVYSNTAYEGGGLYFQGSPYFGLGSVRIDQTAIYSNTASLSAGLENHSGTATTPVMVQNSNLNHNKASTYGGAIGNYGVMDIFTTTLDANTAALKGGGLYIYEGGQVDLEQSTLSRNAAQTGGGIFSELFIHNTAMLTVVNSTFSGNSASQDGAGIYAQGGQVKIYSTTIDSNHIIVPQNISYTGLGGGLYVSPGVIFSAENSLIADNTHQYQPGLPVADDCDGTVNSLGYNLVETTTNCTFTGNVTGNITALYPHLGTLQNYGGPTQTQIPLIGSPAMDAGQSIECIRPDGSPLLVDQRGFSRPQGAGCDIGAVEALAFPIYLPLLER
jgi:CSLREA domain-containing protein